MGCLDGPGAGVVSRLAPTPSGYLHVGNAVNLVLAWQCVRALGGTLWLRIDDLDAARVRGEYVEDIFRTLEWLGLDWDAGPEGPDALAGVWSQRHRMGAYIAAADVLCAGGRVFACRRSRAEIAAACAEGGYPAAFRPAEGAVVWRAGLAADTALRFRTPDEPVEICEWGAGPQRVSLGGELRDFVVLRRDGLPSYQLACVVDDALMGVNTLVRGADLWGSSGAQALLRGALGLGPAGGVMWHWHHPLVAGPGGEKLSKSAGAAAVRGRVSPGQIHEAVAAYRAMPGDVTFSGLWHLG